MTNLVRGVGTYEKGSYSSRVNGITSREYALWGSMLERCYSKKFLERCPTYAPCTVSDNFKYFQYFAEWCQSQVGFNMDKYQLDKDYLSDGKIYSEECCVFIPKELNCFLTDHKAGRGEYMIGVSMHKATNKYVAQINYQNRVKHLGLFESEEYAFAVYKEAKESYAKELANKYSGIVDIRVVSSLQNFVVKA